MNQPRFLITTADQATWKFDQPVIFLGEWCKPYDQKAIWERMDYITAAPYGLGKTKKDSDNTKARELEYKLFPRVCDLLNHYHGTTHSERYWRIILGNWFSRTTDVLFNRIMTLQQCFDSCNICGTTVYANNNYHLVPHDSNSAVWAFNDDYWNNALNERILHLSGKQYIITDYIYKDFQKLFLTESKCVASDSSLKILRVLKSKCIEITSRILGRMSRETDAFIISSYLPRIFEFKLHINLGQFPQIWKLPKLKPIAKPNFKNRKYLAKQLGKESADHMEKLISALLFEVMPICFLEDYNEIKKLSNNLPWPSKPKFIFTSNCFDTNELFKFWTASKVELGVKYFIGQHGNVYGVARNLLNPSNEEIVSDKFLTWGWSDGLPQHTPAFIFKTVGKKAKDFNPSGSLLLIEMTVDHRIYTGDSTFEYLDYFNDQINFVNNLGKGPLENLLIRLYSPLKSLNGCDEDKWNEFDPTLKIDNGARSIRKLICDSRLVVHSYDSTGILETLSLNQPTLAFWQNDLEHLRESAIPYYQLLVDVGIFHLSAESASNKVNEVWDNIEGWWRQSTLQAARDEFCSRYALVSKSPIKVLMKILT